MDSGELFMGVVIGWIFGLFSWIFFIGFIVHPANIDYEAGYQTIDVTKITKYNDGMQIVETTAYTELFGFRASKNYTYTDPKKLISGLGIHKIKKDDTSVNRQISSVISVVEVVS